MISAFALIAVALLIGGMVFFAAIMAPLVFTKLPAEQAGAFIRQVFPVYYLYVLIVSALAATALLPLRTPDALAMLLVVALTLWLRQWLMPGINRLSDAARTGDTAAKRGFDSAHRLSVIVNLAQMVAAGVVLVRFVV
jgi:hypothetical protein